MWQPILIETAKAALLQAMQSVLAIILVIILLIISLIASQVIKTMVTRALRKLHFDKFSPCIALAKVLEKGGISYSFSELIGIISYWFGFLLSLVIILNAIGLTIAVGLISEIVLYIPNVVATILILLLGIFFASILNNFVKTAALNVGIKQGGGLGKFVELVMIIFAIIMALEQLKIRVKIVEIAIGIALASIGLAVSIAFGLGGKKVMGRLIEEAIKKNK